MKYKQFDQEEKDIIKAFDNDELERVSQVKKEKDRLMSLAKAGLKKTKNVNIRLPESVLYKIKAKAIENGLPYQTLMASLLYKYANDQVSAKI